MTTAFRVHIRNSLFSCPKTEFLLNVSLISAAKHEAKAAHRICFLIRAKIASVPNLFSYHMINSCWPVLSYILYTACFVLNNTPDQSNTCAKMVLHQISSPLFFCTQSSRSKSTFHNPLGNKETMMNPSRISCCIKNIMLEEALSVYWIALILDSLNQNKM